MRHQSYLAVLGLSLLWFREAMQRELKAMRTVDTLALHEDGTELKLVNARGKTVVYEKIGEVKMVRDE